MMAIRSVFRGVAREDKPFPSEFQGTVQYIRYRKEDSGWTIAQVVDEDSSGEIRTVVGIMDVEIGVTYRFSGDVDTAGGYGPQLKMKTYELVIPSDSRGMQNYLASGLFTNVGPRRASEIMDLANHSVERLIAIMEQEPQALARIDGITAARAELITQEWRACKQGRNTLTRLHRYRLTPWQISKLFQKYGDGAVDVLEKDPYQIIGDIDRFGFATVDGIARRTGVAGNDPRRARAAVIHVLEQGAESGGHTWMTVDEIAEVADSPKSVNIGADNIKHAVEDLLRENRGIIAVPGGVALTGLYEAEVESAAMIAAMIGKTA